MPCDPNEQGRKNRRAEDDPEGGLREIAARRLLGKLASDEFEVAFNQGEVGSGLIGLAQRQDVIVRHMHVMPEGSCVILTRLLDPRNANMGYIPMLHRVRQPVAIFCGIITTPTAFG
jgi:hypothetical protein